jgi:glycosyltransferase EpsD
MKKIIFVSNTANFSKFNKPYMKWCTQNGWQVDYCAPNDEVVTDCDNHIVLLIPRSPFSRGVFKCIKDL